MQRPGTDVRSAGALHDFGVAAFADTTMCRLHSVSRSPVSRLPGIVR